MITKEQLPALNAVLLGRVVTWAAADDAHLNDLLAEFPGWGRWDQGAWAQEVRNGVCQTAYCIAGQVAAQSDMMFDHSFHDVNSYEVEHLFDVSHADGDLRYSSAHMVYPAKIKRTKKGKKKRVADTSKPGVSVSDFARDTLGLLDREADDLFSSGNSIGRIVGLAIEFCEARFVPPDALDLPPHVLEQADEFVYDDYHREYIYEGYHSPFAQNVV